MADVVEAGNTLKVGKMTISPLTRDELEGFLTYQYFIRARRRLIG